MTITTVGTSAALENALKTARGGDTILLQPGVYSGLGIDGLPIYDPPVVITSADPAHPAVLTNFNIGINSPSIGGLTFTHLDFQVVLPCFGAFNVYNGRHITWDRVHIYGPAGQPDDPDAQALNVFDSSDIAFTNNEVERASHGFSICRSSRITVTGNNIHDVNSDTLNFVQVDGVLIRGNALHDFYPTEGNHPDAIQFGTANSTTPSHDVTIGDNLIYRGAGENAQGIFLGDEVGTLPFQAFTIAGNIIIGTGSSAIRPTHNVGLTLSGNDLLTLVGGDPTPILVQFSDQVRSTGNAAVSISYGDAIHGDASTNVTESGNALNQPVSQADAAAKVAAWYAGHQGAWSSAAAPAPAPAPVPDPRDARIAELAAQLAIEAALAVRYAAGLNTVIRLGAAANAKRQGPTKADMAGVIAAAKAALA